MLRGTYREWVDAGAPGVFTFNLIGIQRTIQITAHETGDGWSQPYYAVYVRPLAIGSRPDRFSFAADAVEAGVLEWTTVGEVTDG